MLFPGYQHFRTFFTYTRPHIKYHCIVQLKKQLIFPWVHICHLHELCDPVKFNLTPLSWNHRPYSSTAQQIWSVSKASDTTFSEWRDYHWSVYEIQWWAHDTSSLHSSPIHTAGIWAQTQDLENPGETRQWHWKGGWERSGQLPAEDIRKKVNEACSKKNKMT